MKSETITDLIEATHHRDCKIRRAALLQLCPCRVRSNHMEVWDRIIAMGRDSDAGVRSIVLHNLCDGSPHAREADVVAVIEQLANDTDKKLRRRARNALSIYRRTGVINIE